MSTVRTLRWFDAAAEEVHSIPQEETICVIGLGYIGLPTASALATSGWSVIGVEVDEEILAGLRAGRTAIEEPGLRLIVKAAISSGNLSPSATVQPADVYIICVPTPFTAEKTADLSYVVSVTKQIAALLRPGNLVILESTVPPGTTTEVMLPILEESGLTGGDDFYVAHCPERVIPGNLLNELIANDRIIGGLTPASAEKAKAIYQTFVDGRIHRTDATTAELVKAMENTYRAVNIALANEMALVSHELGVEVDEAIKLANRHPRVDFLSPGPGVGGHCIPIDPWFIVEKAPEAATMIRAALERNAAMPRYVIERVSEGLAVVDKELEGAHIALFGVAYKRDVDDARETPATPIIAGLEAAGASVAIYDPYVNEYYRPLAEDPLEAVRGADALLIVTDHSSFGALDLVELAEYMRERPVLVDTRSIIPLVPERWTAVRF